MRDDIRAAHDLVRRQIEEFTMDVGIAPVVAQVERSAPIAVVKEGERRIPVLPGAPKELAELALEKLRERQPYLGARLGRIQDEGYCITTVFPEEEFELIPEEVDGVPVLVRAPNPTGGGSLASLNSLVGSLPESITYAVSIGVVTYTSIKYLYNLVKGFMEVKDGEGVVLKSDLFGNHSVRDLFANWDHEWRPKLEKMVRDEDEMVPFRDERKAEVVSLVTDTVESMKKAAIGAEAADAFIRTNILTKRLQPYLFASSEEIGVFVGSLPVSDAVKTAVIQELVLEFEERALREREEALREQRVA